ncbi:atp-depentend dna [Moniliophthora roreri]|nr:atp-depentend dna [Moniliophthora roreri]
MIIPDQLQYHNSNASITTAFNQPGGLNFLFVYPPVTRPIPSLRFAPIVGAASPPD